MIVRFLILRVLPVMLFACASQLHAQSVALFNIDASKFPQIEGDFIVLDSLGNIVEVPASDLILLENTLPVDQSFTVQCPPSQTVIPMSVVLVSDRSGSMDTPIENGNGLKRIDLLKAGIGVFLRAVKLAAPAAVALTAFDDAPAIIKDFSVNTDSLLNALQFMIPGGGTVYNPAFMDPLLGGIGLLKTRPSSIPRVLVFLTDGEPNDSVLVDSIVGAAKNANVIIYAVTIGMPMNKDLETIALSTGGKAYGGISTVDQIKGVYAQIALTSMGLKPCHVVWRTQQGCGPNSVYRTVSLGLRRDPSLTAGITYKAPPQSAMQLQLGASFLYFNTSTSSDRTVTITARNHSFSVDSFYFVPPGKFTVTNWGGSAPPFTLAEGESRTLTIHFRPTDSSIVSSQLKLVTSPCPTNAISLNGGARQFGKLLGLRLLEPIGGEQYSGCDSVTIRWSGVSVTDTVKLEYIRRGYPWTTITAKATGLQYTWFPPAPDTSYRIRISARYKTENVITTIAGGGAGDETGPADQAKMFIPTGQALDTVAHLLYVAENGSHRIRRISLDSNTISTIAGTGAPGYAGDGQFGYNARLSNPYSVGVFNKNLYIADYSNHRIRKVDLVSGIITTYAGTGESGFAGDGGQAIDARLQYPAGLAIANGKLYFSEVGNNRVRVVDLSTNIISTAAGGGVVPLGENVTATSILLQTPTGICVYGDSLFIAERTGHRIRCVNLTNNLIFTYAGEGTAGFAGDGGQAINALFNEPGGVGVNSDAIFINDAQNNRIRRIDRSTGIISTFAGNGTTGSYADNIPASSARLDNPGQPTANDKLIVFPDYYIDRIRAITLVSDGMDSSGSTFSVATPRLAVGSQIQGKIINMGNRALGSARDSVVFATICNVGALPLGLDSARIIGTQAGDFKIVSGLSTGDIMPGNCHALEFRFKPSALGFRRAFAIIYGRCGGEDTVELRGTGVPACGVQVLSSVNLGIGVTSATNPDSVIKTAICNRGTAPVSGNIVISPPNPSFVITAGGGPFTLLPNECRDISIVFAPKDIGLITGAISYTIDPQCGSAVTLLLGEGRAPQLIGVPDVIGFTREQCYNGAHDTVIVIRNIGGAPLRITDVTLSQSGNAYSLLPPLPTDITPMVIAANAEDSLHIRYDPVTAGTHTATVYFKSNAPFGKTSLTLTGTRDSMNLMSVQPIVFFDGSATGPAFPRDTVAHVKNTGTVPMTIRSATLTGGDAFRFNVPSGQFPIVVQVDSVADVVVQALGPTTDSTYRTTLRLVTEPTCDSGIVTIPLVEPGSAPMLAAQPPVFRHLICNGELSDTTVTLTNVGTSPLIISGMSIQNDPEGNFSASWNLSITLQASESRTLPIRFAPSSSGTKTATLVLQTNALPSQQSIALSGKKDSVGYTIQPTSVLYTNLKTNQPLDRQIVLVNTGDLPLTWSLPSNIGPFRVISVNPASALPGEQSIVVLRFEGAASFGEYRDTLPVADKRCNLGSRIPLLAVVGEDILTRTSLPVLSARINERITIPMRMQPSNLSDFRQTGAQDYTATVTYRGTVFVLDSVIHATIVSKNFDGRTGIETVNIRGSYNPATQDTLCRFAGIAIAGDTDVTPLRIQSFAWTGVPNIIIETVDGLLKVTGNCFENGLRLSVHPKILRIRPHPVDATNTSIDFSIDQPVAVHAQLRNILGETACDLGEAYYTAGEHTLTINCGKLPSGVYTLILQTLYGQTVEQVIVAR